MAETFKLLNSEGVHHPGTKTGNEVINLSSHNLSSAENNLLQKGLKFVPTPANITHSPFLKAASDFGRKIKLIRFFHYKRWCTEPFTPKSIWEPPTSKIPPDIIKTISDIEKDIGNLSIPKFHANIPEAEKTAIQDLKSNKSLIIKKADKGSATVLMNKQDYIFECNRQLSNSEHYEPIVESKQEENSKKITKILAEMNERGIISDKQFSYLKPPKTPRPRRFYTLPKIHKPQETWSVPHKIPPGRPIISNCNSETEKVAEYIESYLKSKSTQHPSYIKNTQDFISKIKEIEIPENALLITLDVESMYTNINNMDGIQAVEELFSDNVNDHVYPYIKKLLEQTLNNNDFEFNGSRYIQKSGVSMGIKFAPSFADIFMAKWEKEAFKKYPHSPRFYCRFLDDIFMIWTHGIEKFNELLTILNSHHPTIKLKATISETEVNFLDTTVYRSELEHSRLYTKVYFKPTDTHALLHKTSFHPKSTFRGIIKSQILRFKSICTTHSDFNQAWHVLFKALCKRHYSKRWLRKIKKDTLSEIESNDRAGLECAIPGNSKDGHFQCNLKFSCLTCQSSQTCHNFIGSNTDHIYPIRGRICCKSRNLIYLIECKLCADQYVGQTGRELRQRFLEHRRALLNDDESYAITKHFLEKHPREPINPGNLPIYVIGIENIPDQGSNEKNLQKRLEREQFWIDTLVTFHPHGLNEDRWNWKERVERKNLPSIPFIVPFCKTGKAAGEIVKAYYKKIQEEHDHVFTHNVIVAFKKHKNLQDILVSSKL